MSQQKGIVVNVRIEVEDYVAPILSSEADLREALTNLMLNSVEAMPSTRRATRTPRYTLENPTIGAHK
jgi:signal transduction histidine kinase